MTSSTSPPSHADLIPSGSAKVYPRALLLSIYTAAIEQGFVWITPLPQADAVGLRAKLNRLRRRSDTSAKSFITPNHYLVTFGNWEPGPDGRGRMSAMFSATGSGEPDDALPGLQLADGTSLATAEAPVFPAPLPATTAAPSQPPLAEADFNLSEDAIDDFVSKMMADASRKAAEEPQS